VAHIVVFKQEKHKMHESEINIAAQLQNFLVLCNRRGYEKYTAELHTKNVYVIEGEATRTISALGFKLTIKVLEQINRNAVDDQYCIILLSGGNEDRNDLFQLWQAHELPLHLFAKSSVQAIARFLRNTKKDQND